MKDGKGRVWKEWTVPSVPGFNAVDYDLSADPVLADANEESLKKEAAEAATKPKETPVEEVGARADEKVDEIAEPVPKPELPADEEDDADEGAPKSTPPEIADLLADPLRKTRVRYLPPGRYTVEIAVGAEKAKTHLLVKPPKKDAAEPEED